MDAPDGSGSHNERGELDELLDALKQRPRREEIWKVLIAKYGPSMLAFSERDLKRAGCADGESSPEDAVQDAWAIIDRRVDPSYPHTFLKATFLFDQLRAALKRIKRRQRFKGRVRGPGGAENDILDHIEDRRDLGADVRAVLKELCERAKDQVTDEEWQIVQHRLVDGLTCRKIDEIFGMTQGTASRKYKTAIAKMHEALHTNYDDFFPHSA